MIAFYITAHGYGHAARSLEVIEALQQHHPVTIVSQVPESFFRRRLGESLQLRPKAFDLGLIQLDSVRGDVPATLAGYQQLMQQHVYVNKQPHHTDHQLILLVSTVCI